MFGMDIAICILSVFNNVAPCVRRRMSGMQDERRVHIAMRIETHLRECPNAADTVEGIAAWWLHGEGGLVDQECVQQALDYLVAQGKVMCIHSPDGHVLYAKHI